MIFRHVLLATALLFSWGGCFAQALYDTPESRRLQAERQQAEEQQRAASESTRGSLLQRKEAEAKTYVGKTFWFLPNPNAISRVRFYERVPPSSFSNDPEYIFTPLTVTSFLVIGVVMPPPVEYAEGHDEYLLEIRFADGKVGYVNVVNCCGLKNNLYEGVPDVNKEYVSAESPDAISAREAEARLAVERRQEAETLRRKQEVEQWSRQSDIEARKNAERQRKINEARSARLALPNPRIGMSKQQVINQTNWGHPRDVNRTTYRTGTREQWVYDNKRYLYFENDVLTAIQD